MKTIRGVLSLVFAITTSFSSVGFSSPDIFSNSKYSEGSTEYVRVTKNIDNTVSFEYCESAAAKTCDQIGKKKSYRLIELQRKYKQLRNDGFQMARSDILFIVASALASTIALTLSATPVGWTTIGVTVLGGGVGSSIFVLKGYITPDAPTSYRKYLLARTLTDKILSDEPVTIDEPIYKFVDKLDEVLGTIP